MKEITVTLSDSDLESRCVRCVKTASNRLKEARHIPELELWAASEVELPKGWTKFANHSKMPVCAECRRLVNAAILEKLEELGQTMPGEVRASFLFFKDE